MEPGAEGFLLPFAPFKLPFADKGLREPDSCAILINRYRSGSDEDNQICFAMLGFIVRVCQKYAKRSDTADVNGVACGQVTVSGRRN